MSIARVQTSKFAARLGQVIKCGKCGDPIVKGHTYRWYKVGFRSRTRHIRCMKPTCTPRASELDSSLMSGVWGGQEAAGDALDALEAGDPEDDSSNVNHAVQDYGVALTDVGEQYRDAADAMGSAGEEMGEKADTLADSGADLDDWTASTEEPDFDDCENEEHATERSDGEATLPRGDSSCESCADIASSWWSDIIQEARDAIDNADLP